MTTGKNPVLVGIILIFAGVVLFWASTRKTLTQTARGFLEGQGTIAIPAGLAAIAYGASKEVKASARKQVRTKPKLEPKDTSEK